MGSYHNGLGADKLLYSVITRLVLNLNHKRSFIVFIAAIRCCCVHTPPSVELVVFVVECCVAASSLQETCPRAVVLWALPSTILALAMQYCLLVSPTKTNEERNSPVIAIMCYVISMFIMLAVIHAWTFGGGNAIITVPPSIVSATTSLSSTYWGVTNLIVFFAWWRALHTVFPHSVLKQQHALSKMCVKRCYPLFRVSICRLDYSVSISNKEKVTNY